MKTKLKDHTNILILCIVIFACIILFFLYPKEKQKYDQREIVSSYIKGRINKRLVIDKDQLYNIYNPHVRYSSGDYDFLIVTYLAEDDCTGCQLKLFQWKNFISKCSKMCKNIKLELLIIISPQKTKEVQYELNAYQQKFAVYIDKNNSFSKRNNLEQVIYPFRTFLVGRNDHVIVVGNPLVNNKIGNLMIKRMLTLQ